MSRALTMPQTMSVAAVQVWGRTLGQGLLARDWWHHHWKLVRHPWHSGGTMIRVALVQIVARLDKKKAVRTENGTEDNAQKASRQKPELTAISA